MTEAGKTIGDALAAHAASVDASSETARALAVEREAQVKAAASQLPASVTDAAATPNPTA